MNWYTFTKGADDLKWNTTPDVLSSLPMYLQITSETTSHEHVRLSSELMADPSITHPLKSPTTHQPLESRSLLSLLLHTERLPLVFQHCHRVKCLTFQSIGKVTTLPRPPPPATSPPNPWPVPSSASPSHPPPSSWLACPSSNPIPSSHASSRRR